MAEDIAGKTVQVLESMLNYFANERHWVKNNYRDGGDGHCLVDAAMHFSAKLGLPYNSVVSPLEAALPRRQMGLVTFNDRCHTRDELRTVIRQARVIALENAEHERAAAALQRRFLAELEQERAARKAAENTRETYILSPRTLDEAIAPQHLAACAVGGTLLHGSAAVTGQGLDREF
jgi:hypothetical protein